MNFVSCVKWIRKGVAKPNPENINLNEDEIKEILDDIVEPEEENESSPEVTGDTEDEYDMKNYDDEDSSFRASIKSMIEFGKKKRKKKNKVRVEDSSDSEKEDEVIKGSDNLLLVGHVDGDMSTVDVYVYNEEEGDLYIHHDLMLNSPPLCTEWLGVETAECTNNLCAVGMMNPVIELWDLDIMNCVEPIFKLGRHKKKNPDKNFGHTDAVLSLAWNNKLTHILCSGSVDEKALLWDLDAGTVATEISSFDDKVQGLLWNPHNTSSLLTGCADGIVRLFDCRVYDKFAKLDLNSSIESIVWHSTNEFISFAGTEDGKIYELDWRRIDGPVFQFEAHQNEVTGLGVITCDSKLLLSVSTDELVKIWSIKDNKSKLLCERDFKLEAVHCVDMNPDYPFVACIGGSSQNSNKNVTKIIDIQGLLDELSRIPKHVVVANDIVLPTTSVPLLEDDSEKNNIKSTKMIKTKSKLVKTSKKAKKRKHMSQF